MRKSIALFLTLVFISIVMIILGKIFSIYKNFSNETFYKDISQNSVLIKDIKSILDKNIKDLNKSNIKNIFVNFPFSDKNGDFRVFVKITPLSNRININLIKNKRVLKYFQNILEYYQTADPLLLKDLLLDTLDLDKKEREANSEIILKKPFFKQGKIYTFNQFKKILDYYKNLTNDNSIYKIPWQKLFFFNPYTSIIDCNLLSKKEAYFLGLKFNNEVNCKTLNSFKENQNILKELNITSFSKNRNYLVKIDIFYNENNISLIYNISQKTIKEINYKMVY